MKRRRLIAILSALVLFTAVCLSYSEFQVWNPISAGAGVLGVCFFGKDYVQVQNFPHCVIIAQPNHQTLKDWMTDRGCTELPEEQMGSIQVFQAADGKLSHVRVQMNGYFAKWIWH